MSDGLKQILDESYPLLHARGDFVRKDDAYPGYDLLLALMHQHGLPAFEPGLLDFGCGPGGGLARTWPGAHPYDPYVPGYELDPWVRSYDVVYSADVLEHMMPGQVQDFLLKTRQANPKLVFLVISTRGAKEHKKLTNGMNVHILVQDAAWWLEFVRAGLGVDYRVVVASQDLLEGAVTLAFVRR